MTLEDKLAVVLTLMILIQLSLFLLTLFICTALTQIPVYRYVSYSYQPLTNQGSIIHRILMFDLIQERKVWLHRMWIHRIAVFNVHCLIFSNCNIGHALMHRWLAIILFVHFVLFTFGDDRRHITSFIPCIHCTWLESNLLLNARMKSLESKCKVPQIALTLVRWVAPNIKLCMDVDTCSVLIFFYFLIESKGHKERHLIYLTMCVCMGILILGPIIFTM